MVARAPGTAWAPGTARPGMAGTSLSAATSPAGCRYPLEDARLPAQGQPCQDNHLAPVAHGLFLLHHREHHHPACYGAITTDSHCVFKSHLQDTAELIYLSSIATPGRSLTTCPLLPHLSPQSIPFPSPGMVASGQSTALPLPEGVFTGRQR